MCIVLHHINDKQALLFDSSFKFIIIIIRFPSLCLGNRSRRDTSPKAKMLYCQSYPFSVLIHYLWQDFFEVLLKKLIVIFKYGLKCCDCSFHSCFYFFQWVLVEQACNMYSMTIVPLYDTLGPESCAYIINQGNWYEIYLLFARTYWATELKLLIWQLFLSWIKCLVRMWFANC